MAKDGTMRGGMRIGAGRKKNPAKKKREKGRGETSFQDFSQFYNPMLYLGSEEKAASEISVIEIYSKISDWLKKYGCENLVDDFLIEQYAISIERWHQCEHKISQFGLTGKHPTTGGEMASVYVKMSQDYLKIMSQLRAQIYQIIKDGDGENSSGGDNDGMEILLRTRRSRD